MVLAEGAGNGDMTMLMMNFDGYDDEVKVLECVVGFYPFKGDGIWSYGIGGLTHWSGTVSLLAVRWWGLCWAIELDEHDCFSVAVLV